MMTDLFNVSDFCEECTIGEVKYTCVCSKMDVGESFTASGLENECAFTLDFKTADNVPVTLNEAIIFRGKTYKVERLEPDSANASIKVYLLDPTQR